MPDSTSAHRQYMRRTRFLKIIAWFTFSLILLLAIGIWILSFEKVQQLLVQRGARYLSEKLHTKVSVNRAHLAFFNSFEMEGVYVEDQQQDTLAYIGKIELRASELLSSYWNDNKAIIKTIGIEDAYIYLHRKQDSIWNYDFVAEAFGGSSEQPDQQPEIQKQQPVTKPAGFEIDLKHLRLTRVRFYMLDGWRGEDMTFEIDDVNLHAKSMDLSNKRIALEKLIIDGADIAVREYDGYRPKREKIIDSTDWGTPFNPGLYQIVANEISLKNAAFAYTDGNDIPLPHEFDEEHIQVTGLQIDLKNTRIFADTIFSTINNLKATERCGLQIASLQADLKLSQVHAALSKLTLQTAYSTIQDHVELNYRNFHDFEHFITNVNMKANLKQTHVSTLDIGYFANIINEYPIAVKLEGELDGTVDYLKANNLEIRARNSNFVAMPLSPVCPIWIVLFLMSPISCYKQPVKI
jgi:hypothetical protein